jgi:hypothetical protein
MSVFNSVECVICLDETPTQIFNPCRHKCTCEGCSKQITEASLLCPLCRSDIKEVTSSDVDGDFKEIDSDILEDFLQNKRKKYISKFRVAKNTGWKGNSKQARAVNSNICNELEQRERETKGGDRCMSKNKVVELIEDQLHVTFKIGRKSFKEQYEYDETIREEPTLELAINEPNKYWISYFNRKKEKK